MEPGTFESAVSADKPTLIEDHAPENVEHDTTTATKVQDEPEARADDIASLENAEGDTEKRDAGLLEAEQVAVGALDKDAEVETEAGVEAAMDPERKVEDGEEELPQGDSPDGANETPEVNEEDPVEEKPTEESIQDQGLEEASNEKSAKVSDEAPEDVQEDVPEETPKDVSGEVNEEPTPAEPLAKTPEDASEEPTPVEPSVKAQRRISKLPVLGKPAALGSYGSLRPPTTGKTIPSPTSPRAPTTAKPAVARPAATPSLRKPTSIVAPKATGDIKSKPPVSSASNTTRTSTINRLATPKAPAVVKKTSSSQLATPAAAPTRKPSNSRLSAAPAATVTRKASGSNLSTPSTVVRKTSNPKMAPAASKAPAVTKKPSTSTLGAPSAQTVARKTSASNLSTASGPKKTPAASAATSTPPTPKKSYGSLAKKPSTNQLDSKAAPGKRSVTAGTVPPVTPTKPPAKPPVQKRQVSTPVRTPAARPASTPKAAAAAEAVDAGPKKKMSLRETIAAAKAAAKKQAMAAGSPAVAGAASLDSFNFDIADPFNTGAGQSMGASMLKKRIRSARSDGRLNVSNMELKAIPKEVYDMYKAGSDDEDDDGPKWYESAEMKRIILADNEIEAIEEHFAEVFGGLQSIDAHNNCLTAVPKNWSRLGLLTSLNLTNNKLTNDTLLDIFSITTLVDLKLAKNQLSGELPPSVSELASLEVLDISNNEIEALPETISSLSRLRILHAGYNKIGKVTFAHLADCPLQELVFANNCIVGTLIEGGISEMRKLHTLDIRNNRIEKLSEGNISLPALHTFTATNNNMQSFPSVEGWDELLTFICDYNHLTGLPEGMPSLPKLRILDFTGNEFTSIDPQIALMESLEVVKFEGNPIKELRLASMGAGDLKNALKKRLGPVEGEGEEEKEAPVKYEIRPGGILDLSNRDYEEIPEDLFDSLPSSPSTIVLARNSLTAIPSSLSTFASLATLDFSRNKLSGTLYLPEKLILPSLHTLNISANNISSIEPLLTNLDAPRLATLDISANRITSLTGLRSAFPLLTTLYAQNNQIEDIDVDAVDGVRVLDLSSNSIAHLPPKLGTVNSITDLRVQGNLFRAPRWQILNKGTDAVMSWLRDKLPSEDTEELD